jgi:hypothetical protein
MRVIERSFSELLRQPNEVVKDLDDHEVLLRRRGAPALRLTLADRDVDRSIAFAMVGRALRNLAIHSPDVLEQVLLDEFPWTSFLPEPDRQIFLTEFTRTVVAVAEVDNFAPLAQLVYEWRTTAEIHSDPTLASKLRRSIAGEGSRVLRPAG